MFTILKKVYNCNTNYFKTKLAKALNDIKVYDINYVLPQNNSLENKINYSVYYNFLVEQFYSKYYKNKEYSGRFNEQKTTDNSQVASFNAQTEESFNQWVNYCSIPLGVFLLNYLSKEEKMKCEEMKDFTKDNLSSNSDISQFKRPYLGCSIRKKDEGMQIVMIKSGSPAELKGLLVRDIILEIDGQKITSINEYYSAIGLEKGEKSIKLKKSINQETNEYEVVEVKIEFL